MIVLQQFADAFAAHVGHELATRPIFWTLYIAWIVGAGFSAQHYLERRPLLGTLCAVGSAAAFAIVVAIGGA